MAKKIDIHDGDMYKGLEVISFVGYDNHKKRKFRFKCNCGNEFECVLQSVTRGLTTSCGCNAKNLMSKRFTIHGHSTRDKKLYHSYKDMISRCENKNHVQYDSYGARGISVCKDWRKDIKEFIDWAKCNGYKEGLKLDRINNDGNYEPSNCRFVDQFVQSQNQRLLSSKNKSGYRGVYKNSKGKFVAQICIFGHRIHLGTFNNPIDAAIRYDNEVKERGGNHPLNFN